MKEKLLKTTGFVIKTTRIGEADKVILLYLEHFGKIQAIAKGARKLKNRFGGSLEPCTLLQLMIYYKDSNSIGIIRETEVLNTFQNIRQDLKKLILAFYFLDLLDEMVKQKDSSLPIFKLLVETFDLLDTGKYTPEIARLFEYKLLKLIGIMPVFDKCNRCKKLIGNNIFPPVACFINIYKNTIHCENCSSNGDIPLYSETVQYLNKISKIELKSALRITLTEKINQQLKFLFHSIVVNYTGRKLKSIDILKKL